MLELGCGPGNVSQYILGERPDLMITGIDLAPNMVTLASFNNPTASYKTLDCREIATIDQEFNAIIGAFVLPYLTRAECAQLIKDCTTLLSGNGILYLSTMEGDYEQSGFQNTSFSAGDSVHIHYHQKDYIIQCLEGHGFEILQFIRQDCPEADGRNFTDMIFIARKA